MTWPVNTFPWIDGLPPQPAAIRVIVDNDFAGDPDDYVQLAHHLLSPSVEIVGIIASHLGKQGGFTDAPDTAAQARLAVEKLAAVMDVDLGDIVRTGSEEPMPDRATPVASPAVDLIIAEALKDDARPLYVCCGGGLTELASALLTRPEIAERLTVVWIGGPEYPGTTEPVPGNPAEYNLCIDVASAQAVLDSAVEFWQVPRDAYRQCLITDAELRTRIKPLGELGALLVAELSKVEAWVAGHFGVRRETYVIGDSPLVSLTALQTVFESTPASSVFETRPAVQLGDDGHPIGWEGRPIRVFTRIDVRLIVEDLVAKLTEFRDWRQSA